jgi:hypothetical protein
MIIDKEITLIRDNIDLFTDIPFLDECLSFVYDEDMRPDAEVGKHDDILLSDCIGEAARTQQKYAPKVEEKPKSVIYEHKSKLAKQSTMLRYRHY